MTTDCTHAPPACASCAKPEPRAGWMIRRLKPGEGFVISTPQGEIELRISLVNGQPKGDAQLALRAPKSLLIRPVR